MATGRRRLSRRAKWALFALAAVAGGGATLGAALLRGGATGDTGAATLRGGGGDAMVRARRYLREGRMDDARDACREAIRQDPLNGTAYAELGNIYLLRGDLPRAVAALETAAELAPNYPGNLARLAQAYLDSRRVDSAYKTIEAALGQEPRNPYALMLKGELLLRDERFQEALPLFQAAIREDPSISLAYLKAGYILVKSQRLEEAERVLRDGLKRDPHNPGLHLQLAETFYLRPSAPGAAADAEKHYQLAIPDNPAAANAHSRLGELALRRGDEPTARTHFEKAVELDPFLPDALYGLGRLEAKSGNTKRSDALLRQAKLRRDAATRLGELKARAQANPEDPDLACRVARYALEHNLLAEAERQVERAVRWKPDHAEARRLRADLYSRQARLEEARNEYRVAGAL